MPGPDELHREQRGLTTLLAPDGSTILPERLTVTSAIFRMQNPMPGTYAWQFPLPPPPPPDEQPRVLLEVALRSPCRLMTRTDVEGGVLASPENPGLDDRRWAGRNVLLQAVVHDGDVARADATIHARLRRPDGSLRVVTLFDDGRHQDGAPADGVFAAKLLDTAQAGTYTVTYSGHLQPGLDLPATCVRERSDAVTLRAGIDADADGLPDWWQTRFGLAPGSAGLDPDRDGLSNADEFLAHTSPTQSDTDGGGESDASELEAGRDANDPGDDVIGKPALVAAPGNARILLATGVTPGDGATLEIQSSSTRSGSFVPVDVAVSSRNGVLFVPAPNDVETCYTARLRTADAASGWASIVCATPRTDPVPPTIETIRLTGAARCARRPSVQIEIRAVDGVIDSAIGSELGEMADPSVESSGITDMKVWSDASPNDTWQPFAPLVSLSVGDGPSATMVVVLRDGAGNVTPAGTLAVARCNGTDLDRAILLEERAIRRIDSGDLAGARGLIQQSLDDLAKSIDNVQVRVQTPHDPDHVADVELLARLVKVRAQKVVAVHTGGPNAAAKARDAISGALNQEYDIGDLAVAHGKAL